MTYITKPPNCTFYKEGKMCTNKNVKRSLFGLGARTCSLENPFPKECLYQQKKPKPKFQKRPRLNPEYVTRIL